MVKSWFPTRSQFVYGRRLEHSLSHSLTLIPSSRAWLVGPAVSELWIVVGLLLCLSLQHYTHSLALTWLPVTRLS